MEQKNYKIVIADDDDFLRSILINSFKIAGFNVLEAKDGLEAFNIIIKDKPDAVISGIMMPNMGGFELLKILKENVESSKIPVFIFSHLGREEDRKKADGLGAKSFMVKGMISPKEMVDLVNNTLSSKVYQVEVNINKLDGPRLANDVHCPDKIILELNPESGSSDSFRAKVVCKEFES